jgi:hypothetical protein
MKYRQIQKARVLSVLAGFLIALGLMGCGTTTFTKSHLGFEPFAADENMQTKSGITIERCMLKGSPFDFFATVQGCTPCTGEMHIDSDGTPVMKRVVALPKNSRVEKIAITNNTGHVIRLNPTVFAAFDPADHQFDILSKEDIISCLMQERPCASTEQLAQQLSRVKVIDRNTELPPNSTTTGYLVYKTEGPVPGVWRLSIHELPIETNSAGSPTQTVNFDFRSVCKVYKNTYQKEPFAEPVLVSTEEVHIAPKSEQASTPSAISERRASLPSFF